MKLPIPTLLYLTSAGLFGLAAWTVYEMLPLWKDSVRKAATDKGQTEAIDKIALGHGQGPVTGVEWSYSRATSEWWSAFRNVNLIGKLPPPPPEKGPEEPPPPPPPPPIKPLEEIFELVASVHDSEGGKDSNSHVIIRYRTEANVQPPEWYVRENMMPPGGSTPAPGPRDLAPSRSGGRANGSGQPVPRPASTRPTSPMPTSSAGHEILQKLWVDDGGDPRRSSQLWEPFADIRLVRVAADAQSAFFMRTPPLAKAGEPVVEPKEEELLKTTLSLSQDVLRELRRLQGRSEEKTQRPAVPLAGPTKWMDVQETTQIGNVRHIGRQDEQRFRDNGEQFLSQLNLDTYVSKTSKLKGLQVRNVDPQLATRFGVAQGDVLIEVNGRSVQTRAQAMQMGKADYERGVRTFQTKWWSNGQIVDRIYQAPDR